MKSSELFDQLVEFIRTSGPSTAAQLLVDTMRSEKRYTELFEALKMFHRVELGLPAVQIDPTGVSAEDAASQLDPEIQDKLDKRLVESCREVGTALLKQGSLQEGWMYMRAVGDRKATADAMKDLEVTHENLDAILGLLVHEAVDVGRGTQLSLDLRGTCNTITMLESVVAMRGRSDPQAAVSTLVKHVHRELLESVKSDIVRREKLDASSQVNSENSLEKLLATRPTLLRDGSYHLDTTHLSSTVRFARILDDKETLSLAVDLAQYGRQLHPQYQYASEEPFAELYPMSLAFFRALLGEHIETALRMFLQKAESLDPQEHGTIAIETYADLLTRVGRPMEAMQFLMKRMPRGMRPYGIAPSLIELSQEAGDFEPMKTHARERGDIVGFAAALLQEATHK